jgi:hypothetical protein
MEVMERKLALNNVACIQFGPRIPSDQHYIRFNNGDGCSSPVIIFIIYNLSLISSEVEQMTGLCVDHIVTLEYPGCFTNALMMHELLHTLGNCYIYLLTLHLNFKNFSLLFYLIECI